MPPISEISEGRSHGASDDPRAASRRPEPVFGVHWLITGGLLGGGTWTVIGAVIAAAFGSWSLAGGLLVVGAVLMVALVLLARGSARGQRAMAAVPRRPRLRVVNPTKDRDVA